MKNNSFSLSQTVFVILTQKNTFHIEKGYEYEILHWKNSSLEGIKSFESRLKLVSTREKIPLLEIFQIDFSLETAFPVTHILLFFQLQ